MNTYSVSYWPPNSGSAVPTTTTVQGTDFVLEDGFLVFLSDNVVGHASFAIPTALNPVVTLTTSA